MIVSKLLIGDGAELYLPLALSKLRFYATQWTGAYQSHVIQADDGSTIMMEVMAKDRGRVTIFAGVSFVSVGVENTAYKSVIRGQTDHKLPFRKLPGVLSPSIGTLKLLPCPERRVLAAHINYRGTAGSYTDFAFTSTLGFISANGQYSKLYKANYDRPAHTGGEYTIETSFCYLNDRRMLQLVGHQRTSADAPYNRNYEVELLISKDDGKTWDTKVPGGASPISVAFPAATPDTDPVTHWDKNVYVSEIQYVGDKTAMVIAGETISDDILSFMHTYPKLVRTVDNGDSWTTTSLQSAFAWAYRCYPTGSGGYVFDAPTGLSFPSIGGNYDYLIYNTFIPATQFTPLGNDVLLMTGYHLYPEGYHPGFYNAGYNAIGKTYAVFAHRSTNNGASWDGEGVYIGDEMRAIIPLGKNAAAASVQWNGQTYITLSNDGGLTWTRRLTPVQPGDGFPPNGLMLLKTAVLTSLGAVDLSKVQLACMVIEGDNHTLFYTVDGAQTWQRGGLVSNVPLTAEPHPAELNIPFPLYDAEFQFASVALLSKDGSTAFKNFYLNNGPL